MNLDDKEEVMIRHYSAIFKRHCFDEYDVLGLQWMAAHVSGRLLGFYYNIFWEDLL